MRFTPFTMERYQSTFEHRVRINLSESGVHPLTVDELLEIAGTDAGVGGIRLGYGQSNGSDELRHKVAAQYEGATENNVLVTVGGAEANFTCFWHLFETEEKAAVILPTYGQVPGLIDSFEGRIMPVHLVEENDWQPDLEALEAALEAGARFVLITNPNNPTGTAVHVDQLRRLVEQVPDDVLVVVDEAYREFVTADLGDPITDLQPDHPNVVVLRTFSKAFGLAALRTGYAVADPDVVIELDKVLIAFAVNHLAQVASLAAIAARDEVQAVVDLITAERDRVVASLRSDGWDLPDAHANFVYLPLGSRTDVVFPEMEKRGVVVRPFPGVGMRVTIGTPAQNDRFLATLAEVTAGS